MNTDPSQPDAAEQENRQTRRMRFNLTELAGSLGDMGTFLPLTVALAVSTRLDLAWMLIAAGLMNIASGWLFRMPVPVQPMKAIAAVAIALGLSGGAVVASGWVMGVVLTVIAVTGLMPLIDRCVPRPVVRAIQLGVGLKLCQSALSNVAGLDLIAADGLLVAAGVGGVLILGAVRRWPVVLPVFLVGFVVIAINDIRVFTGLGIALPMPQWITPSGAEWREGLLQGALPQLPLTLLNSVIAVCALTRDYYPDRAVSPRKMALSVGVMNLLCVGWSGMPMCHGSGGLAAQHGAGARTGGSVVMLGVGKVLAGVAFGASLTPLLVSYPAAVLGPLVALAGVTIAMAGIRPTRGRDWLVVLPTAVAIVFTNMLYGFGIGVTLYLLLYAIQAVKNKSANTDKSA